jgi:hypothetical protein
MEKNGSIISRRDALFSAGALIGWSGLLARGRLIEQGISDAKAKADQAQAKATASSTLGEAKTAMQDYANNMDALVSESTGLGLIMGERQQ